MNPAPITAAISAASSKAAATTTALEAQQYAQAVLSLAHALATVEAINRDAKK